VRPTATRHSARRCSRYSKSRGRVDANCRRKKRAKPNKAGLVLTAAARGARCQSLETRAAGSLNQRAELPFTLRLDDFRLAMQDIYDFFFDVNSFLVGRSLQRLEETRFERRSRPGFSPTY